MGVEWQGKEAEQGPSLMPPCLPACLSLPLLSVSKASNEMQLGGSPSGAGLGEKSRLGLQQGGGLERTRDLMHFSWFSQRTVFSTYVGNCIKNVQQIYLVLFNPLKDTKRPMFPEPYSVPVTELRNRTPPLTMAAGL